MATDCRTGSPALALCCCSENTMSPLLNVMATRSDVQRQESAQGASQGPVGWWLLCPDRGTHCEAASRHSSLFTVVAGGFLPNTPYSVQGSQTTHRIRGQVSHKHLVYTCHGDAVALHPLPHKGPRGHTRGSCPQDPELLVIGQGHCSGLALAPYSICGPKSNRGLEEIYKAGGAGWKQKGTQQEHSTCLWARSVVVPEPCSQLPSLWLPILWGAATASVLSTWYKIQS